MQRTGILLGLFGAAMLWLTVPANADAAFSRTPEVRLFDGTEQLDSFNAFDAGFEGGAQVVAADLGNDGIEELIVAPGAGGAPHIRVLRPDGSELYTFLAYDETMRAGVNLAVGDLNHDGLVDIVTAPRYGATSHVRVFDRAGRIQFTPGFFAYDEGFRGGVSVAVGDLDGDGYDDIITAAGSGGGPHVRVFDRYGTPLNGFFPFHPDFRGGINVAVANVDGGAEDELIVAVQRYDSPWVKVLKANPREQVLGFFQAFDGSFKGGVQISGADVNGDGVEEIIAAAGAGGGPHVRVISGSGQVLPYNLFAYESDFRGGVNVTGADTDGDGIDEIVTAPGAWRAEGRTDLPKYVQVDLSEQRLYAYEQGRLVKTFLVSTGLPGMDTQTGTFHISQRTLSKLYSGPDYYLPNTLWNMRFDGPRWLHGAYWHNDFGRRKSHGCVNIAYPNAEWLYNWSGIGTTVIVTE